MLPAKILFILLLIFGGLFLSPKIFADWSTDFYIPLCTSLTFNPRSPVASGTIVAIKADISDSSGIDSAFLQRGSSTLASTARTLGTAPVSLSYTWDTAITGPGTYNFNVSATDKAGNVNLYCALDTYTVTTPPAPTCNAVNLKNATGNYGLISSVVPTANRINWAYSDILAGTASACTVMITGCGSGTGARGCYVTPDAGTSHYRARVDFTPTTGTCNITFILHPPVSRGDTCSGTSAPVCSPVNGVCSTWSSWSCSGNNKTRSRTYTPPSCGGSDVTCFPLTETVSCNDYNSCTTDSCSAGNCVNTFNPVTCSAFLKTSGGDVHSNQ